MQRQRGELVPIGEVVADLGGPVQALRETPPPARRGFTLADQVNQLVGASEADPDRGFMARTMALCSLPRSNPGNRLQYKRVNGPFTLYMTVTGGNKLPFGNLPRVPQRQRDGSSRALAEALAFVAGTLPTRRLVRRFAQDARLASERNPAVARGLYVRTCGSRGISRYFLTRSVCSEIVGCRAAYWSRRV